VVSGLDELCRAHGMDGMPWHDLIIDCPTSLHVLDEPALGTAVALMEDLARARQAT
jgi:hypothetical protein